MQRRSSQVLSLHAGPWACMHFPEITWSSISLHEVPRACMQFHELGCSFMNLHEVSWACMQFPYLSEQLTGILKCLLKFIQSWKKKTFGWICTNVVIYFLSKGGNKIEHHFSQSFLVKINLFLCSFKMKVPDFFKTLPNFVLSLHQIAQKCENMKILLYCSL